MLFCRTAIVGKASCGDVIKLQVKIQNGIIEDVKFKVHLHFVLSAIHKSLFGRHLDVAQP